MGQLDEYLADVDNKKLQKILERVANYNWVLSHIKVKDNNICEAFSRLCIQICLDFYKYINKSPRLLQMSKRATIRKKQLEEEYQD